MTLAQRRILSTALVLLGALLAACCWFGVQTTGDYERDFAPAMNALLAGHVHTFFGLLPEDGAGASIVLRAPAALIGKLLGGGELSTFRFGAFACLLGTGGLGLWLAREMRGWGRPPVERAAVIGLCTIGPGVLSAIFFGHPEEPLGAALCVGAVLLAGERPALAGIALGLALINKPWGVFAVAPVLLAAHGRGRLTIVAIVAAIGVTWELTLLLFARRYFPHQLSAISPVAHPVDLWWPFARPTVVPGGRHVYLAPHVLLSWGRDLAVLLAVPLSVPLARRSLRPREDCLALLALLLLLRCLLDPSNHVYYEVPFVIALVAWEAAAGRAPALSLLATGLLWLVFHTVSGVASLDVQFVAYLAVTIPFLLVLLREIGIAGAPARRVQLSLS